MYFEKVALPPRTYLQLVVKAHSGSVYSTTATLGQHVGHAEILLLLGSASS